METTHKASVIVIGAGLSGLSAAITLLESMEVAKVVILEARKRVGGRTESIPVDGERVDVGAQWVALQHIEMLSYCKQYGLELLDQYYPPPSQSQFNKYECCLTECINYPKQFSTINDSKAVHGYIDLMEDLSKSIDLSSPWLHPQAHEWDLISIDAHIHNQNYSKVATLELLLFVQVVFAAIPSEISFLFALFLIKSGGGIAALSDGNDGAQRYKVKGGTQQISELLLNQMLTQYSDKFEIYFDEAVEEVIINPDDQSVEVISRNSHIYHGNHVIISISPKLTSQIIFHPPLPSGQKVLFESMVSGHAIKVFLTYAEPFWLQMDHSLLKDDTVHQNNEEYIHFTKLGYIHNLYHASFRTSVINNDSKLEKITTNTTTISSAATVTTSAVATPMAEQNDELPALVGLITGQAAIDFELLSEIERKKAIVNQLHQMYSHHPLAFTPFHYIEKIWSHEEFSKGCYACSFPPTGVFSKYGHYLRDREDSHSCLHWASTETAEHFYGYMEGAVRSGQRAAREIIL